MTDSAPECEALAEGLREVRARTGLSLAALAARTPYSKSSWERYLNGKKPVPRQAVEALCALAGERPGRLAALWELADARWSGRTGSRPQPAEPVAPSRTGGTGPAPAVEPPAAEPLPAGPHRWPRWPRWLLAACAAAAAVAAALTLLSVRPGAGHSAGAAPPVLNPSPGCQGESCDGKDPDLMNCGLPGRADSVGPEHRTATGAGMEIRHSRACAASWGRLWHAAVGDAIEITAPGAQPRRVVVTTTADAARYCFTPMISTRDLSAVRLCFLPAGRTGRECVRA